MSRYVIEIKPEYEDKFRGIMILGAENSNLYVDSVAVDELEELNSDYINEHFGDLQDEAYQKGINDGSLDVKQRVEGAYQRGLNDAWEAARKIVEMSAPQYWELFDAYKENLFGKISASEAINKIKAYEEKQKADNKIEVGDIVERYLDNKLDSTGIYLGDADEKGDYWNCLFWTGASYITLGYPKYQFKKTGRHVDVASLLEDMRND